MGYVRHNAILATCWQDNAADALLAYCEEIGAQAVAGGGVVNGYRTVCIMPDGSKEGWDSSNEGDERRAKVRAWLREVGSRDTGALYFEWCEVVYGDDDSAASIVHHAWSDPQ